MRMAHTPSIRSDSHRPTKPLVIYRPLCNCALKLSNTLPSKPSTDAITPTTAKVRDTKAFHSFWLCKSKVRKAIPLAIAATSNDELKVWYNCSWVGSKMRYSKITNPDISSAAPSTDRKSTRLNSSHVRISYAVFCLKKKKKSQ